MSIASAIENAQTKVAACYTSVDTMGGTLPETQNLSNLPTAIESIPQGGGSGTYVLAHDTTGLIWPDDDDKKVLIRYELPDVTKKQEFTIAATNNSTGGQTYVQPVWFNNNLFCVFAGFEGGNVTGSFAYAYNGSTWIKTAITGTHNIGTSNGVWFRWVDNAGILCVRGFSGGGSAKTQNRYLIDSSGQTTDASGSDYYSLIGYIGGVRWRSYTYSSNFGESSLSGIWADSTHVIANTHTYKGHFIDVKNRLLLYTYDSDTPHIAKIGSDNISLDFDYSSGNIGTGCFIGCTGLAPNDYVFFADDYTKETCNNYSRYNNSTNVPYGTTASSYSAYKVGTDYKLHQIDSSDTLYPFINIDKSLWRFDNRNNCLVIGTTNNVYVLEFKSDKTWSLIASDMTLPDNNLGQYIYNAALSPDKTKLTVYAGDTNKYAQNLFIYDIDTGYTWTVVNNVAQNYDSVLTFTGTYGGEVYNVETQEYYAVVNTTLPSEVTVECSLESDYEPVLSIV